VTLRRRLVGLRWRSFGFGYIFAVDRDDGPGGNRLGFLFVAFVKTDCVSLRVTLADTSWFATMQWMITVPHKSFDAIFDMREAAHG